MPADHAPFWYTNRDARTWRTARPVTAIDFHRTLVGYAPTPLTSLPGLAEELGVGHVLVKDESDRLGLPAFKVLGASWALCRALCERFGLDVSTMTVASLRTALQEISVSQALPIVTSATEGNHGRAVAWMSRRLGLASRIYVPRGLSTVAIDGIAGEGAELILMDAAYDDVVDAAARAASGDEGVLLVQDTSWTGYTDVPQWIVDGYDTLFLEIDAALVDIGIDTPALVACPVGVGSLAHAMVNHYKSADLKVSPALLSVEPDTAACVTNSLSLGHPVTVDTSAPTIMAGLNCGTPSELGWPTLLGGLDAAVTVSDDQCRQALRDLSALGQDAGPCGGASLAGARLALGEVQRRRSLKIDKTSVVVLLITKGSAANPLR